MTTATTACASTNERAQPAAQRRVRIAIIGGGFAGLGMGIRLRQEGIGDFEVLERANELGGTWRDNSYPGCAVDVMSHLYSYSFAPNPNWSSVFSPQREIWGYISDCAEKYGVIDRVRFGQEVSSADWDQARQLWRVQTSAGPLEAQFLISAIGPLSKVSLPDIPGLNTFAGACFHTAVWDHDHDLTGERVAVIGTGCSAAQVIPAIQPAVSRLLVFQRTPPWTFPRMNRRITGIEHALYRCSPALQRLARTRQYWRQELVGIFLQRPSRVAVLESLMRARLRRHVRDPELRSKLTPKYRIGCKRIIVSDDYLQTVTRANVEVITSPITRIERSSIMTEDGTDHPVDTIVLATGFHPFHAADPLTGCDGTTLAARWSERREAYLGTTVAGFPNYFILLGPNTATGHTSALLYVEAQIDYIIDALDRLERHGMASLEVRAEAQAGYNADLRKKLRNTVWTSGGCGSWYLDADGGTSIIWPGYTWQFRRALRRFDAGAYELRATASSANPNGDS